MGCFDGLLDPRIAVAEAPLTAEPEPLLGDEAAEIAGAVPHRHREFAAGRTCARRAMAALGHARVPLPRGQDRMPVWPEGLVGSITHTGTRVAAALGWRRQGFAAIGIDLEPAGPLPTELWPSICTADEWAGLATTCGLAPAIAVRLVFCLKEAAFKCQYPLSRAMLEFNDLAISPGPEAGTFSATYRRDAPPFRTDDPITGRFAVRDGHLAAAAVLTASPASSGKR